MDSKLIYLILSSMLKVAFVRFCVVTLLGKATLLKTETNYKMHFTLFYSTLTQISKKGHSTEVLTFKTKLTIPLYSHFDAYSVSSRI